MSGKGSLTGVYLTIQTYVQVCHDVMQLQHMQYIIRAAAASVAPNAGAEARADTPATRVPSRFGVCNAVRVARANTAATGVLLRTSVYTVVRAERVARDGTTNHWRIAGGTGTEEGKNARDAKKHTDQVSQL